MIHTGRFRPEPGVSTLGTHGKGRWSLQSGWHTARQSEIKITYHI